MKRLARPAAVVASAIALTLATPLPVTAGTDDTPYVATLEDPLGDAKADTGTPSEAQIRGTDLTATGVEVRHGKKRSKDRILLSWTVDDFYEDYAADGAFVEFKAQMKIKRLRKQGGEKTKKMGVQVGFDKHGDWAYARPTKPGRRGCSSSTDTPGEPLKGHRKYIRVRRDENTLTLTLKTVCFSDPEGLQSISDLVLWTSSFTDPVNDTFDRTDEAYPIISMLPPTSED